MNLEIERPFIYKASFRTYDLNNSYRINLLIDEPLTLSEAYEQIEEERLDRVTDLTVNGKTTSWDAITRTAWAIKGADWNKEAFRLGQELAQSTFIKLNR